MTTHTKAPRQAHADPVAVDPKHYKVELENEQVRVLRISYGPHEKSVMHGHPAGVLVCLADFHVKFTSPDGKTEERRGKAGEVIWALLKSTCLKIWPLSAWKASWSSLNGSGTSSFSPRLSD